MNVIFLRPLNSRMIGDIFEVADGYARNFLIPNGIAAIATKNNIENFVRQKKELEQKHEHEQSNARKVADAIGTGYYLIFIREADANGKLFGSVTIKEIIKELCKSVINNMQVGIVLPNAVQALKSIGIFTVQVILHHDLSVNVYVVVARSDVDANFIIEAHKADLSKLGI